MNQVAKPLYSVLIKPAGPDCNMACGYCFYRHKASLWPDGKIHRMSEAILEETVRQVMTQAGERVVFIWQGGEPTLMGLSFFKKVVELQMRFGGNQIVGNALQTNGLVLDESWVRFLKRYNFFVGLSLDGPRHVHDHYRLTASGQGTWSRTLEAAKILLEADVDTNALAVINDYSVQFPDDIHQFLKENGLRYMQFIPCVEPDPDDPSKPAYFTAPAEAFGQFLRRIFDLWLADFKNGVPTTSVRFFDTLLHIYTGNQPPECSQLSECGVYLVIEYDGGVYPCDFWVEPSWRLGSVASDKLVDLLNSDRQQAFGRMKASLPDECRDCRWLSVCRGGCTRHRLPIGRDNALNHFCRAYKVFFEHADEQLRNLVRQWRDKQPA